MPRNRSAGRTAVPSRAPTRPTVPASNPMAQQQQQRPASTMAAPPQQMAPAPSQGPGLFGQMASTAAGSRQRDEMAPAPGISDPYFLTPDQTLQNKDYDYYIELTPCSGVAIGSSVGHAIGGLFGGSSEPAPQPVQAQAQQQQTQQTQWGNNCQAATQQFTKCMDDNSGNMQICNWYLEQLKACQAAASQY
ncbi:hypothetical protein ED733_002600 [Metarhizium rileyi]|uniref:CHCH domain protein n=1 Tax=Metarhizium rileyi (strain RCEF 4871) TaxID=1649241 RepID=A0A5C6GAU1_METRR|nr:hypothetical protein ED733_002600 [Metarhizium rileyi]